MRDLQLRIGVRLQSWIERVDDNETNVEHAGNEFLYELPHLTEQLPHLVAVVLG